jgi:hypothetical protein
MIHPHTEDSQGIPVFLAVDSSIDSIDLIDPAFSPILGVERSSKSSLVVKSTYGKDKEQYYNFHIGSHNHFFGGDGHFICGGEISDNSYLRISNDGNYSYSYESVALATNEERTIDTNQSWYLPQSAILLVGCESKSNVGAMIFV